MSNWPETGKFAFTSDGIGSGIITQVGVEHVWIDNNVNINKYKIEDIEVIE